jgi:hypothetical protein
LGLNEFGTATITVRATDSGTAFVEDVFDVVVTGDNDVPFIVSAIPDTSVVKGNPPINKYRDLNDVFSDREDGSALSFTIESNSDPQLLTVVIDVDSAVSLSFHPRRKGEATVVIRATDSGALFVEDTLVVTIIQTNKNGSPSANQGTSELTVSGGETFIDNYYDLNEVFTDPEEDGALNFAVRSNSNPTLVTAVIDADSALDLRITPARSGSATIIIRATDSGGLFVENTLAVTVLGTQAAPAPVVPEHPALFQNAPNPFNPTTTIRFDTAEPGPVELRIYDVSGRLVRTLINRDLPPARHETVWDGRSDSGVPVASGVYFYRLVTREYRATKKMLMLK